MFIIMMIVSDNIAIIDYVLVALHYFPTDVSDLFSFCCCSCCCLFVFNIWRREQLSFFYGLVAFE